MHQLKIDSLFNNYNFFINISTLTYYLKKKSSKSLKKFRCGLQEAYCIMLNKLKEAMKEPLQETESFIEGMYKQLNEINENHPEPNSSA